MNLKKTKNKKINTKKQRIECSEHKKNKEIPKQREVFIKFHAKYEIERSPNKTRKQKNVKKRNQQ